MKYVIALLATLFALPALAHGPTMSVSTEPTSGIVNTGDRISVMLDFDLAAQAAAELSLQDLFDVTTEVPADGTVLTYLSGTGKWKGQPVATDLAGLTDVTVSGASEGQTLIWDGTTGKWLNSGTDLPTTFASGDTSPSVANNTSFVSSPTAQTWIARLDDAVEGLTYFVTFTNSNTIIDFTGGLLKGNDGKLWLPTSSDFMSCRYQSGIGICDVSGSTGISGILPMELGPNQEFIFDAAGTLTLTTPGAGIVVAPSDTLGSQMVLPSSTNSGGNAFTLKVLDAGLTNAVTCLIEADGALDAACPLLTNDPFSTSESIREAVRAHIPQDAVSAKLAQWIPWGTADTIVLISNLMFNDREFSTYGSSAGESYLVFDEVLNLDPTNLTKQSTYADTTECNGVTNPTSPGGTYNCAAELVFNTVGTYQVRITMIGNPGRRYEYGLTSQFGFGGPQELLSGGLEPTPHNFCSLYWYKNNNTNLFSRAEGGPGFTPSINASTPQGCWQGMSSSAGGTSANVCGNKGEYFSQAVATTTISSPGEYIGGYRFSYLPVGTTQMVDHPVDLYFAAVKGVGYCSWTGGQGMGRIIIEARKI